MNEDHKHWLALTMVKGIGAVRFKTLLEKFGDAKTAWNATESQLSEADLAPKILEHFLALRETLDLDRLPLELEKQNTSALTMQEANYPRRLKEIDQSPPIL